MSQIANEWMDLLILLPETDRAEIARRLMESLEGAGSHEADWESSWVKELEMRAERMRSGAVQGIPFEDVLAAIRKKLP